jgi:ribose-phosphate pyrophosphokinase
MTEALADKLIIVGNASDDPFAIDLAYAIGQNTDIADLISMKTFANGEFCPRFISDENDLTRIGHQLTGKTVVIVSTTSRVMSRQNLAMRTLVMARAAKENGASEVILVEPDLFYSAQDRGPHADLGKTDFDRDVHDLKQFDGQPFTGQLYAQLLHVAGVDRVITVHNHSRSVQRVFADIFEDRFHNLIPYELYADYLLNANIVQHGQHGEGFVLCAPDKGARPFVTELFERLGLSKAKLVVLDKARSGERSVDITLHPDFADAAEAVAGRDVVLLDDMVRTGSTVVKACRYLRSLQPRRVVFGVTHFYASDEGRQKMADGALDEILTLNTLPTVLNRDVQGRLRRKMVVLKIERWLARYLADLLGLDGRAKALREDSLYQIDMSSKNPRFLRKIWSNEQLPELTGRRMHIHPGEGV